MGPTSLKCCSSTLWTYWAMDKSSLNRACIFRIFRRNSFTTITCRPFLLKASIGQVSTNVRRYSSSSFVRSGDTGILASSSFTDISGGTSGGGSLFGSRYRGLALLPYMSRNSCASLLSNPSATSFFAMTRHTLMILRISATSSGRLLPFSSRLSGGIIVERNRPLRPVVAPSLKKRELLLRTVSSDWSPSSST